MRENICKFPTPHLCEALDVRCFVLETNGAHPPARLRSHRMILTMGEGVVITIDGEKLLPSVGELVFGFCGEELMIEFPEGATLMYIDFEGGRAEELLVRFDIRRGRRRFEGYEGLIPLWGESLSRADERSIDLASESILLYSLSRLSGSVSSRSTLIGQVVELTEKHFHDPELSVEVLARELSYHPKYLSRAFKEKMGVTFSEYLRSVRIKYAITLFNHGIDSVKNVALLSGFSDPLYFSTVFKSIVGLSPKEYKRTAEKH